MDVKNKETNINARLERVDKILVSQNLGSRKEVHGFIKKGNLKINGEKIKKVDFKVNPEKDEIILFDKAVNFKRYIYIMMNKPSGVLSASRDKREKTIIDLIPSELYRRNLFPAGRLDRDTTGLMIITDDGDFCHNMLSPKKKVYKLYHARVDKKVTQQDINVFKKGIILNDGTEFLPSELAILEDGEKPLVSVRICEGKFHQVKLMFAATQKKVLSLKRVQIGQLALDESLGLGECRELSKDEINSIFKL